MTFSFGTLGKSIKKIGLIILLAKTWLFRQLTATPSTKFLKAPKI